MGESEEWRLLSLGVFMIRVFYFVSMGVRKERKKFLKENGYMW